MERRHERGQRRELRRLRAEVPILQQRAEAAAYRAVIARSKAHARRYGGGSGLGKIAKGLQSYGVGMGDRATDMLLGGTGRQREWFELPKFKLPKIKNEPTERRR